MTNRPKEITMRYSGETDREIKEVTISETDTVRVILSRLKAKSNFHLADSEDKPFGIEDVPFGYVSIPSSPPLRLLHGSALRGKVREATIRKDNRIVVEARFRDGKAVFPRGVQPTYATVLEQARDNFGITDPCHIEKVRADEDRILVDIEVGEDNGWFTEKACPPLKLADDKIYAESVGTGGWGSPLLLHQCKQEQQQQQRLLRKLSESKTSSFTILKRMKWNPLEERRNTEMH
jgi:hypothetical protein